MQRRARQTDADDHVLEMLEMTPQQSPARTEHSSGHQTIVSGVRDPSIPPSATRYEETHGIKPRARPSVTPRSFRRFFQPRALSSRRHKPSTARKVLKDITSKGNNGAPRSLGPFPDLNVRGDENNASHSLTFPKKRKVPLSPESSPIAPSKLRRTLTKPSDIQPSLASPTLASSIPDDHSELEETPGPELFQSPIKRISSRCTSTRVLHRSLNDRAFQRQIPNLATWRDETSNFYSRPSDTHLCCNVETPERVPPFCSTTCNTNSLVAIGDEEGGVRLLDSAKNVKPGFSDSYLKFRPHTNAILDLSFSSDDLLLATASGDQTACIIDMPTRRILSTLAGHVSSVKQVRFQPGQGSNNVVATSSRDGNVHIWDLRCRGLQAPVRQVQVNLASDGLSSGAENNVEKSIWARPLNSLLGSHANRKPIGNAYLPSKPAQGLDVPSKSEAPGRCGDVSVTSVTFMSNGQEHLLATASEANACVKLWDIRMTQTHRRGPAVPLSTTKQPTSHDGYRQFGVNSLALSGDGARLYSLCRDNTVYAYSTSHLALGSVPELSVPTGRARRSRGHGKEGLGPLYGFRHPQLHATSFYVKLDVRKANGDKTELLAVGSSDGCAVLFPTNEGYFGRRLAGSAHLSHTSETPLATPRTPRSGLSRCSSGSSLAARPSDTMPIYEHGTALVRGHEKEVTGVSWTADGELVTVGDDFLVRCWREGPDARDLRRGGEEGGRRWACGWADTTEDDDDEDDSDE